MSDNKLRAEARQDPAWTEFVQDDVWPDDEWSSLVLIRVFLNGTVQDGKVIRETFPLLGYIFVVDETKRERKVKLPGGHKEKGETPRETASREVRGETGLVIPPEHMHYVSRDWREGKKDHWSCLFVTDIEEDQAGMVHSDDPENGGEVPGMYSAEQFDQYARDGTFLWYHGLRLERARLI